ncbi:MAG TPA: vitamin K epoxide reductase family protein [Thermoplasmata archaeon]|nr:vitamin K epoxide reductase family protein [Thermoplasmata archaeon]
MKTRDLRTLVGLSAGLGLVVALFAAAEFYDVSLQAVCSINAFFSCAAVDASGKTSTLGIPDYVWGVLGFVGILVVAAVSEARSVDDRWTYGLVALTTAGVALSVYLLYVELAEIHALCLVCASDYLLVGIAWLGAIALARRARSESSGVAPKRRTDAPG